MPEAGLEPALCCQNWILNPARLPISPLRQDLRGAKYIFVREATPAFKSIISLFYDSGFSGFLKFVFKPDSIEISRDMRVKKSVINQEGVMTH